MTPEYKRVLLADPCVYCGSVPCIDLDHIQPKSKGGGNGWANRAPSCGPCNRMKADGSLLWMLWRLEEVRQGRIVRKNIGHRWVWTPGQGRMRVSIGVRLEYQNAKF